MKDALDALSTSDLQNYQAGNFDKVSTPGLKLIQGSLSTGESPSSTQSSDQYFTGTPWNLTPTPLGESMVQKNRESLLPIAGAMAGMALGPAEAVLPMAMGAGAGQAANQAIKAIPNQRFIPQGKPNFNLNPLAGPAPISGDVALTYAGGKVIPPLMEGAGNIAKSMNIPWANSAIGKVITDAGQQIVDKINMAKSSLQNSYKAALGPYNNSQIDSETFGKLLGMLPKEIRDDFASRFGSTIMDASGKPTTTVGNLQGMKDALNDVINSTNEAKKLATSEQVGRLTDYSKKLADAVKATKEAYLSQIPEASQNAVRALDNVFGDVVSKGNAILGKVSGKGGIINTNFLIKAFQNPDSAGFREALQDMGKYGIDLSKPIDTLQGYASRQGMKYAAKKIFLNPWTYFDSVFAYDALKHR